MDERPNFRSLQSGLLVAPILRQLLLNREPEKVAAWVDEVSRWSFKRIIPCHFSNNIAATPSDFKAAFEFLYEKKVPSPQTASPNVMLAWMNRVFPQTASQSRCPQPVEEDLSLLKAVSDILSKVGILYKVAPPLSRPV